MPLSCLKHVKRGDSTSRPAPPIHIDVTFVGDRSGSMYTMGESAKKGTRGFLEEQQKIAAAGSTVHAEVTTFDNEATTVYNDDVKNLTTTDLARVEEEMEPRGSTRLYDTILEALSRQRERIAQREASLPTIQRKLGVKVLAYLAVMTDGADNVSMARQGHVRSAVQKFRKNGGVASFLAAEQSATHVGGNMGFSKSNCLQMSSNPVHSAAALRSVSNSLKRFVSSGNAEASGFLKMERQSSCNPNDNYNHTASTPPPLTRTHMYPPPIHGSRQNYYNSLVGGSGSLLGGIPPPPPIQTALRSSAVMLNSGIYDSDDDLDFY